ncbi:MAG: L-lactate dehydrogenase [Clostridia bacterium]|nr:L-lactate dehydrogenase [Clostridia bacterium]
MTKITIIGAGNVGSTLAYTLAVTGTADEIVIIDVNQKRAMGEALDIRQSAPFCGPITVYAGDYPDAAGSNIVVVTSGVARKPGQSRLELAQTNVDITKSIIPQITRYAPDATYIIVANPVDILTYTFVRCSDIPANRIIGSGTILDTARLRQRLSEYYSISQQNIHAWVFGEHGDSSFIPWSQATISGVPIDHFDEALHGRSTIAPDLNRTEVEAYVRKSGARIIERKGATYYAIAASVNHICQSLSGRLDRTVTVSTLMQGEYGIRDVCLSIMNVIGSGGVNGKVLYPLTEEEQLLLHKSADALKAIIAELKF